MSNAFIILTPIFIFLVVALVGFVGCGELLPNDAPLEEEEQPPEDKKPKKPWDPAGPVSGAPTSPYLPALPANYEEAVTGIKGFAAFWPLNEMSGKTVAYVGNLTPAANGEYKNAAGADPGIGSYTPGKQGVLFAKDMSDLSVEFAGTEAFIEVPFVPALNPAPSVPGFSIELWAKPNPAAGADRGVLVSSHHFDSTTSQQGYEIGLLKVQGQPHHQVYARVYAGEAMTLSELTLQPVDGDPAAWRHIVFRYAFVAGSGYVLQLRVQVLNTATVNKAQSTTPILYENVTSTKPSTLRFAGSHLPPPGGSAVFAGQLDSIAFYNAVVDDGDFDNHYSMAL